MSLQFHLSWIYPKQETTISYSTL